jgi:hypothetical protein
MKIYQQVDGYWRIEDKHGFKLSQVFKSRKDAQRWMAKRRAIREKSRQYWKGVKSIGEILDDLKNKSEPK